MGGDFVVGVFAPVAEFAEVEAVVAPKDDDGVVGEAESVEGVEKLADEGIDVAHAGIVSVDEGAGFFWGEDFSV